MGTSHGDQGDELYYSILTGAIELIFITTGVCANFAQPEFDVFEN